MPLSEPTIAAVNNNEGVPMSLSGKSRDKMKPAMIGNAATRTPPIAKAKSSLIPLIVVLSTAYLFVSPKPSVGFGITAHRYFACKSIAGLDTYPGVAAEIRANAHCNDCSIFGSCRNVFRPDRLSQLHYELSTSESGTFGMTKAVCGGSDVANYTPPGVRFFRDRLIDYPGDDIVMGAAEEDGGFVLDSKTGKRIPRYLTHFWDPDVDARGLGGGLSLALQPGKKLGSVLRKLHIPACAEADQPQCAERETAYSRARSLWAHAVELYRAGAKREAYYILGRVAHLLSDLTVPAHVHGDTHGGVLAGLFVASPCCGAAHDEKDTDTLEDRVKGKQLLQSFDSLSVSPYRYEQLLSSSLWSALGESSVDGLFRLFWFTAQKTQFWASDGDKDPSPLVKVTGARCDAPQYTADANYICIDYAPQSPGLFRLSNGEVGTPGLPSHLWDDVVPIHQPCEIRALDTKGEAEMARHIAGHTLAAVSGLYRLFWDVTHDADSDGFGVFTDCDEADASIHHGTISSCYDGPAVTANVGECRAGSRSCASGEYSTCEGQVLPSPEVCDDDRDNDCNGAEDCADTACVGSPLCTGSCAGPGTIVVGEITTDTTWTLTGCPYLLQNVSVREGITLTIEPGVVLKGRKDGLYGINSRLLVYGSLVADGTPEAPIVFTSLKDDSVAGDTNEDGDTTAPSPGDWLGIEFAPVSTGSVLANVEIRYSGGNYDCYPFGCPYVRSSSVYTESPDLIVVSSRIMASARDAIFIAGGDPVVSGNTIDGAANGVTIGGGNSTITNNIIRNAADCGLNIATQSMIAGNRVQDNTTGICVGGVVAANVTGNSVSANEKAISGPPGLVSGFSGNTYVGNALDGLWTSGDVRADATWPSDIPVYFIAGTVNVYPGRTLTIEPGVIAKGRKDGLYGINSRVVVDGTLVAQGTSTSPIIFTSLKDDSVGGDSNGDGGTTSPTPGDWLGIEFGVSSSGSLMTNAIVRYAGGIFDCYPFGCSWLKQTAVYSEAADLVISGCEITGSAGNGVASLGTALTVSGSTIANNVGCSVCNYGSSPVIVAEGNFWGHASGPLDTSDDRSSGGLYNPSGAGGWATDHVDYDPWLGSPVMGAVAVQTESAAATADSNSHGRIAYRLPVGVVGKPRRVEIFLKVRGSYFRENIDRVYLSLSCIANCAGGTPGNTSWSKQLYDLPNIQNQFGVIAFDENDDPSEPEFRFVSTAVYALTVSIQTSGNWVVLRGSPLDNGGEFVCIDCTENYGGDALSPYYRIHGDVP